VHLTVSESDGIKAAGFVIYWLDYVTSWLVLEPFICHSPLQSLHLRLVVKSTLSLLLSLLSV